MQLTAEHVEKTFFRCLFEEGESQDRAIVVEGIVNTYGFHPSRLEENRIVVRDLLAELPEKFFEGSGGGYSFLGACEDKTGRQWTGLHRTMEMLFALGLGLGLVKCLLPREMWSILPGGMPYYVVVDA